jgi:hypothetical protein
MCFNRWYKNKTDMITEQLVCEKCFDDLTTTHCGACCEKYNYTELDHKTGCGFGDDFFCKSCVVSINSIINSIDYDPDEYR